MTDKSELTMKSTKLTDDGTISAWDMGPPTIIFTSLRNLPIMTIHPDGRITLGDDAKPTEAAAECVNAMSHMIQNLIDNAVQEERAKIVAWLQDGFKRDFDQLWRGQLIDAIRTGEHLE